MVRLLGLQAHNFKKLRLDSPIQFSDGITLVTGLNESGKSSLLDAILYALFGRVIRPPKAKNEDLVSYGATEGLLALDFEIGDRRFRVTRRIHRTKPTRATLEEVNPNRSTRMLAIGQEKVNDEIVRLLGGVTYQEIVSSTVVAQKELGNIIRLGKEGREHIINVFLNLESFNEVQADLSEERKDLEGTPARPGRVRVELEKLDILKKALDEFTGNQVERTRLLQENADLTRTNQELQTELREKEAFHMNLSEYEAVIRKRESLDLQLEGKRALHGNYQGHSDRLRKEFEEIQRELGKFAGYEEAEPLLRKVKELIETGRTQSLGLASAERSWRAVDQEVKELERKYSTVDRLKIKSQESQLQKPIYPYLAAAGLFFAASIVAFIWTDFLVGVGLVVLASVPASIAAIRLNAKISVAKHQSILGDLRYLEEKKRELSILEAHYGMLRKELRSTEAEIERLCIACRLYASIFTTQENVGSLAAAQSTLEAADRDRERREGLQVKLQTIREEMGKLPSDAAIEDLRREIENLERQVNELVLPKLPEGIVFTRELLSTIQIDREELGRRIAVAQKQIEQNLERVANLDQYLAQHRDIVAKVQSQEQTAKNLERRLEVIRCASEGVRGTAEALRNRIRPSAQAYMSAILPSLTSSRYRHVILDEDYNLQVWDPEAGEYRPREVYSGGTEDQLLLAMRLAFALALLPEVKGQKPEFVFLDEPLGSSDDVRRSGIIEYMASDLAKKFRQIFVISHVGGLEEYAQNIISLDDGRIVRS